MSRTISYVKEEIYIWKTETIYHEIYVAVYGEVMNVSNCQGFKYSIFSFFQSDTKIKIAPKVLIFIIRMYICFWNIWRNFLYFFVSFSYKLLKSLSISDEDGKRFLKVRASFLGSTLYVGLHRNKKPKYAVEVQIKCNFKPRCKMLTIFNAFSLCALNSEHIAKSMKWSWNTPMYLNPCLMQAIYF